MFGQCCCRATVVGAIFDSAMNFLGIMVAIAIPAFFLITAILYLLDRRKAALRQRRLSAGQCTNCGYDLRGTTSRCPECGKPIDLAIKHTSRDGLWWRF